jgi:hypothetical protein
MLSGFAPAIIKVKTHAHALAYRRYRRGGSLGSLVTLLRYERCHPDFASETRRVRRHSMSYHKAFKMRLFGTHRETLTWYPGQWHPLGSYDPTVGCHGPAPAGPCGRMQWFDLERKIVSPHWSRIGSRRAGRSCYVLECDTISRYAAIVASATRPTGMLTIIGRRGRWTRMN